MESFFFSAGEKRYRVSEFGSAEAAQLRRVDISNSVVFVAGRFQKQTQQIDINNLDRMVMLVMAKEGSVEIIDHYTGNSWKVPEGKIGLFASSRQDITLRVPSQPQSELFILFVADFFLKRYLSGKTSAPVDFLYHKIQQELTMESVNLQPIDALSLYIVQRLLKIDQGECMASMLAEHRISEFMIHRFSLLDTPLEGISQEEAALASRAKGILLEDFVSPPTIRELAHLCASNETKLKKVFKKVYQMTIRRYIQKLRLEEANLLLREKYYTIGEIAQRVGYKHQGHFTKLFFSVYGVYPKDLMHH